MSDTGIGVEAPSREAIPLERSRPGPGNAEAAQQFEAFILKMLLAEMRRTVGSGGLLSGGNSTYQVILEDALSRRAAEAGSFGLAQQILQEMREAP